VPRPRKTRRGCLASPYSQAETALIRSPDGLPVHYLNLFAMQRATPRQLALFGFPPPGHPYWTEATLAGTAQRYPGLDMTPWRQALPGEA
jgi:hypothetical protein